MITFKINGTKFRDFPTCWPDVKYWQYIELINPTTIRDQISLFTGIDKKIIEKAELKNLESVAVALEFLKVPPPFEAKPTFMVGPYTMPADVTLQSTGQFEDLRSLMGRGPKKIESVMDHLQMNDLYLEACAIYVNKLEFGEYLPERTPEIKERLKGYSCIEVISTGAFFLFKPLNLSTPIKKPYRSITQRLKKLIQDFPGYQKTLDRLLQSTKSQKG